MATGSGAPKFAMSAKPPKVVQLRRNETLSSFLAWKGNLTYNLALNPHFAPFLEDDIQFRFIHIYSGFVWRKIYYIYIK